MPPSTNWEGISDESLWHPIYMPSPIVAITTDSTLPLPLHVHSSWMLRLGSCPSFLHLIEFRLVQQHWFITAVTDSLCWGGVAWDNRKDSEKCKHAGGLRSLWVCVLIESSKQTVHFVAGPIQHHCLVSCKSIPWFLTGRKSKAQLLSQCHTWSTSKIDVNNQCCFGASDLV